MPCVATAAAATFLWAGSSGHPPNASKPFDLLGNVWEGVADWLGLTRYQISPVVDPADPEIGFLRVLGAVASGGSSCYRARRCGPPTRQRPPQM